MKNIIILLLSILSFTANAQSMQQYMQETRKLVSEGKYSEALKRTIWFHDHAVEKEPGMSAVRTSFALHDWKVLADKYPPALKALKDDRDKKTQLVLSKGDNDAFRDVSAINRTLGENQLTVDLFKKVLATKPHVARSYWYYAKEYLFDAKEYTIIQKYIGSPSEEFESIKRQYNSMTEASTKVPFIARDRITQQNEDKFVTRTLKLIDYAKGIKDIKGAKYVQQQALKVVKSDLLEKAVKS